jgi:hypothetical protein
MSLSSLNGKHLKFDVTSPKLTRYSHSFDSVQDGSVSVFTPHTAFEDPNTPADALPRESIEVRALVFYD